MGRPGVRLEVGGRGRAEEGGGVGRGGAIRTGCGAVHHGEGTMGGDPFVHERPCQTRRKAPGLERRPCRYGNDGLEPVGVADGLSTQRSRNGLSVRSDRHGVAGIRRHQCRLGEVRGERGVYVEAERRCVRGEVLGHRCRRSRRGTDRQHGKGAGREQKRASQGGQSHESWSSCSHVPQLPLDIRIGDFVR